MPPYIWSDANGGSKGKVKRKMSVAKENKIKATRRKNKRTFKTNKFKMK